LVDTDLKEKIHLLLQQVSNPSRYMGNEWNAIIKDHRSSLLKIALAFPDLYEVGMSHLGTRILYQIINSEEDLLAERVFTPAADMEALMRSESVPLFSMESFTPVHQFDLLGFSLQYELNYTNVLNMLDLAGFPLRSEQRKGFPLVVGGGVCAFNPEPLAPFIDFFVLGDGEEVILEIIELLREGKLRETPRPEILQELASLEGVYVPSFYKPKYENGVFAGIEPMGTNTPSTVNKRVLKNLDDAIYPKAPLVPYRQIVHDRAVLEITRGCVRGCRFCQAGVIYRPKRYRSKDNLVNLAVHLIKNTGYEELSLASLSSSDYPDIEELVQRLTAELPSWVNLSLPSLRPDTFSVQLAEEVQKTHKTSLTFAPEAATSRLREVINKKITEESLLAALEYSFAAGWRNIKLYFMIGLPTETDEDVEAIAEMVRRALDLYRRAGYREKLKLSVSVSTFTPKAHTPFQWEPQIPMAEIKRRQKLLYRAFKKTRGIDFKWHDAGTSYLEAAFSRGDRRLADVLEEAWRRGCKFDNWSEHFCLHAWEEVFASRGFSPSDFACKRYEAHDPLPWEHLSGGTSIDFLINEHRKSRRSKTSDENGRRNGGEKTCNA